MHSTLPRLAKSITDKPLNLRKTSATLLPPVPLYRGILRAHRYLPVEMRLLGDDYVKAEFRRHKSVDNPLHIMGFLSQWKVYLDGMPKDKETAARWKGRKLDATVYEKMSTEQIGQLYELMHATKEIWKSPSELEAEAREEEGQAASDHPDDGQNGRER